VGERSRLCMVHGINDLRQVRFDYRPVDGRKGHKGNSAM
jgi:hypothetical protein